jgi:hypothetical protein
MGIGPSRGYHFYPDKSALYLYDNSLSVAYNGSVILYSENTIKMMKSLAFDESFSLIAFDFAGYPTNKEFIVTVTGVYSNGSTIVKTFTPDGQVNGVEGDFESFYLDSKWTDLVSVRWDHSGKFALDNIVVSKSPYNCGIQGDFDSDQKLGLSDCVGILQTLTGLRAK